MRIQLFDIIKHYGAIRANDGISLDVQSGTIHGLLGENGAGKTTCMRIVSGYQSYDGGRIEVDGRRVRFDSPAEAIAAGIGMLHQDPLDVPPLTVLDNFTLGRSGRFFQRRGEGRRQLQELCQRFGLSLGPDEQVSSLTVGERQQLELIRLLSLGVKVIILDEPTTGISAPQKELLFRTLHQLASEGLSVMFVSHKLDEVEELCSEVTVLRQGIVSGRARAPYDTDALVTMMFGQCLRDLPRLDIRLGDPVLWLDDVSIRTHRLSMQHLSWQVRAGEVLGLAGLEGSGQRLMMLACAGLLPVHSGKLVVAEQDMTRKPYHRFLEQGVAFVPAARLEEGMIGEMTIREHVAMSQADGRLFVAWAEAEARARRLIDEFNIVGGVQTPVRALSGGNQQRTLLALLPEQPRLLLLEHPTRGLDLESTQWIWSRLLQRRDHGTAIVFTSTDLDELVENSDRIAVLSGGVMSEPVLASDITCDELGYLIGGRRE